MHAPPARRAAPLGLTLLELVLVLILVGILASLAAPLLTRTRDRTTQAAMASDLRAVALQQETHRARTGRYAPALGMLPDFTPSAGVMLTMTVTGGGRGWYASATHPALPDVACRVFQGGAAPAGFEPSAVAGAVACGPRAEFAPAPEDGVDPEGESEGPLTIHEPEARPPTPPPDP